MEDDSLPEGFRWTWAGDTVRIDLPRFVRTEGHAYEPVLSARDAEGVAQAVDTRERKRRASGGNTKVSRILVAHDPRYAPERLAKFRARLSVALVEYGQEATLDDLVTQSGMEAEDEASAT